MTEPTIIIDWGPDRVDGDTVFRDGAERGGPARFYLKWDPERVTLTTDEEGIRYGMYIPTGDVEPGLRFLAAGRLEKSMLITLAWVRGSR